MNLPRPLRYASAFIVALLVFLALDSIWLTLMAQRLYRPAVGELMREDFDMQAAALFYLIYIGGLLFFVIAPRAARERSVAAWRPVRFRGLRHLRPHQPGDAACVVMAGDGGGPRLGCVRHFDERTRPRTGCCSVRDAPRT